MPLLWLVTLLLGTAFAIAGAQETQQKVINALIILACMAIGLGIGHAAGLGGKNFGSVPNAAIPFSMILGIVAAMTCAAQNKFRSKP